ncbi:unnamed protein product [Protopolystoma xenopodis]|uniref:Uncharacterized protein n=1 Tax=Protopolystoma xenopodis TaxID=117903 RepID=A0A3S4ZUW3_9PLAT|nr:unnamed protein product [Protopolystoma xenopodis]
MLPDTTGLVAPTHYSRQQKQHQVPFSRQHLSVSASPSSSTSASVMVGLISASPEATTAGRPQIVESTMGLTAAAAASGVPQRVRGAPVHRAHSDVSPVLLAGARAQNTGKTLAACLNVGPVKSPAATEGGAGAGLPEVTGLDNWSAGEHELEPPGSKNRPILSASPSEERGGVKMTRGLVQQQQQPSRQTPQMGNYSVRI